MNPKPIIKLTRRMTAKAKFERARGHGASSRKLKRRANIILKLLAECAPIRNGA